MRVIASAFAVVVLLIGCDSSTDGDSFTVPPPAEVAAAFEAQGLAVTVDAVVTRESDEAAYQQHRTETLGGSERHVTAAGHFVLEVNDGSESADLVVLAFDEGDEAEARWLRTFTTGPVYASSYEWLGPAPPVSTFEADGSVVVFGAVPPSGADAQLYAAINAGVSSLSEVVQ